MILICIQLWYLRKLFHEPMRVEGMLEMEVCASHLRRKYTFFKNSSLREGGYL